MNSASMWGRPIKVGRPTQAQPYLKTIESTVIDSKKSTCIYVSSIHEVSRNLENYPVVRFLNWTKMIIQYPNTYIRFNFNETCVLCLRDESYSWLITRYEYPPQPSRYRYHRKSLKPQLYSYLGKIVVLNTGWANQDPECLWSRISTFPNAFSDRLIFI